MSKYTKAAYELFAGIIADAKAQEAFSYWEDAKMVAEKFADEFEKDNELFDRERFLSACGV